VPTPGENSGEAPSDQERVSSRVFDAPRERVFKAWTHPHHLAQWWGPRGFTNTLDEFDLRPGGRRITLAWIPRRLGVPSARA